jgi:hypothetical protein
MQRYWRGAQGSGGGCGWGAQTRGGLPPGHTGPNLTLDNTVAKTEHAGNTHPATTMRGRGGGSLQHRRRRLSSSSRGRPNKLGGLRGGSGGSEPPMSRFYGKGKTSTAPQFMLGFTQVRARSPRTSLPTHPIHTAQETRSVHASSAPMHMVPGVLCNDSQRAVKSKHARRLP